jgi:hypothetical protein
MLTVCVPTIDGVAGWYEKINVKTNAKAEMRCLLEVVGDALTDDVTCQLTETAQF